MFHRFIPTAMLVAVSLLPAYASEPQTLSQARGRSGMVVTVSPPTTAGKKGVSGTCQEPLIAVGKNKRFLTPFRPHLLDDD